MKRQRIDSSLERQFLIGMIMSTPFLASIVPTLKTDVQLLDMKYVRQITGWCLSHFNTYGESPNRSIEAMYHSWVENESPEQSDSDAIHDFLESMSCEYDGKPIINVPFLTDEFSKFLNLRRVQKLKDDITNSLTIGKADEAVIAIQNFKSVSLNDRTGYFFDKAAIMRAFAEKQVPLMQFPSDSKGFFNDAVVRDSLIGIQAPEKRGKTFLLIEFIYRTLRARRKVAIFQVGDLSESQITKRLAVRTSLHPMRWKQCKEGVYIPTSIEVVKLDGVVSPKVTHEVRHFEEPINPRIAIDGRKKFNRRHKLTGRELKISVHANSSINVRGIDTILQQWRLEEDYVPDVIIIDYADILAPEDTRVRETRDQINETWKALRRLSQDWHACVIVPTQANTASYSAKTQTMANFSNDKRKLAHVTGMIGINQTADEKKMGVIRLNWIVLRESEFHVDQCLWVAQCLPLGQAYVKAVC